MLLLLLLRGRVLTAPRSFDAAGLIRDDGCPRTGQLVPFRSAESVRLTDTLFAAFVRIDADASCVHGVFPVSSAVDSSPEQAARRASWEAVERYCLAAIWRHDHRVVVVEPGATDVFRYGFRMCEPFGGPPQAQRALPAVSTTGKRASVACADVFAPFPIRNGACGLPPTTNGVAVSRSFPLAAHRAELELRERDAIMRFWYEGRIGVRVAPDDVIRAAAPAVEFLHAFGYDVHVVKLPSAPVSFLAWAQSAASTYPYSAFGGGSGDGGLRAAVLEIVQTIVALSLMTDTHRAWLAKGGPLRSLEHNMLWYATPELAEDAVCRLAAMPLDSPVADVETEPDVWLVDVTPEELRGETACVRALSNDLRPLVVSESHGPHELVGSPTRLPYPHPFP